MHGHKVTQLMRESTFEVQYIIQAWKPPLPKSKPKGQRQRGDDEDDEKTKKLSVPMTMSWRNEEMKKVQLFLGSKYSKRPNYSHTNEVDVDLRTPNAEDEECNYYEFFHGVCYTKAAAQMTSCCECGREDFKEFLQS